MQRNPSPYETILYGMNPNSELKIHKELDLGWACGPKFVIPIPEKEIGWKVTPGSMQNPLLNEP